MEETKPKSKFLGTILVLISLVLVFILGLNFKNILNLFNNLYEDGVTQEEIVTTDEKEKILMLGHQEVTLPLGWEITEIDIYSEDLSNEQKTSLFTGSNSQVLIEGMYPIYKGYKITISRGNSSIILEHFSDIIAGPFGVTPLEIDDDWTIVLEPKKDSIGFARKAEDGIYKYSTIENCTVEEVCGKYVYITFPYNINFSFVGTEKELEIADNFYKTYIMDLERIGIPTVKAK